MAARRPLDRLYHLAESHNLSSIRKSGLLSAETLVQMTITDCEARGKLLSEQRKKFTVLSDEVMLRDQKPMPPAALAKVLDDGLLPEDWYRMLNRYVFMWPDLDRLLRQRSACGARPQMLMSFDAPALLASFGDHAFLSPINSGSAMRKAARRGLNTFVPYGRWFEAGWPSGDLRRKPAEFVFDCPVPVEPPFLLEIVEI